ncbi:Nif3-like dinuclear metal center hexameric protein [Allofrancisella guangzhouensis]|uniref:GTP cyclohydrolase 1 type 2 homolog n=1 Tax=Allofrancisella guangzhouensis TaxID=594679 RepID=A0A0A8E5E3_9GAMM|nr:Nif3-like dinuclear metal center hexameric protein [Allofrancisella guangzhouensis]AJC49159.1 metal-binding protein [Allofrancisella guangzhouensis]MBK2026783.1 Nif3-like dinuclear metal center hexameric protein [Allofrancisella guangzhouensis]MBK2044024.1 Nif3-like dinuclear metal center hexameric protein [Allofrancisella guangzhouensis]MBK2045328.1 Nif3-like dinuclear metal center hexameric protein [Allofrancisella guangzhouensis]
MHFKELEKFLNNNFEINTYKDYAPNGLQIQGNKDIKKVITGVTACQALIDRAIDENADAIIVHHGYFWKSEDYPITGIKYQRIAKLIKNGIHLFAYHLPLDGHREIGNNILLAKKLNLENVSFFDTGIKPDISVIADCNLDLTSFGKLIAKTLERDPLIINTNNQNKKVAICTGGAQDFIEYAYNAGATTFISGEISERTTHIARELGINYIAAGHHATEKGGVKAIAKLLKEKFDLDTKFIDINNPA